MSWWELPGRPGDVIGDRPADIAADALGRAVAMHSGPTPLPELLGALGRAIARTTGELEDPPGGEARVTAITPAGETEPGPAGEDLAEPLADGIRKVAAAYRERFERNPRLVELLAVFAFVLRPRYPELENLEVRAADPNQTRRGPAAPG